MAAKTTMKEVKRALKKRRLYHEKKEKLANIMKINTVHKDTNTQELERMIEVQRLRIKLGSHDLKTLQIPVDFNNCSNAEKTRPSIGEGLVFDATNQARKRRPQELEEVQANKSQRLDHDWRQCFMVLRLMKEHEFGWIFDEPVDPVKLDIPDYFSVISKPMDLGTIKTKLLKDSYSSSDAFVADVRLTFDNAMLYNPPSNKIHCMAKELKEFFEVNWRSLNKKRTSELSKIKVRKDSKTQTFNVDCPRQRSSFEATTSSESSPLAFSSQVEEKVKKHTPAVRQKALTKKLRKEKPDQGLEFCSSPKICAKGTNKHNGTSTAFGKCDLCGRMTCICLKSCKSSKICPVSDASWQRASRDYYSKVSSLTGGQAKNTSSQVTKSDVHFNELKTSVPDVPVPPEKALRVAMIKGRYADVILKAKHRNTLGQNANIDLIKIQKEKEQMERAQREEQERIEAEIKAAEMAKLTELKQRREKQRIELEKMERAGKMKVSSVAVENEFVYRYGCSRNRKCLEELGLVLKNEVYEDVFMSEPSEAARFSDLEEGEIF